MIGPVMMDAGLIREDSSIRPKAPGMKYKHYAPKADLLIIQGNPEAVAEEIKELAARDEAMRQRVGIIASEETMGRYCGGTVKSIEVFRRRLP